MRVSPKAVADVAKLRACLPPAKLTSDENAMWKDIVIRSPLNAFGIAEQKALKTYVQLTSELEATMAIKKRTRNVVARAARLSTTLRQTALRLNLKELARKEVRGVESTIEAEGDRIEAAMRDPQHPRYQLYGGRVVATDTPRMPRSEYSE